MISNIVKNKYERKGLIVLSSFVQIFEKNKEKGIGCCRCPVDGEIMGEFTYNEDKTEAKVDFQAHKFPYTASVYYQCNVRLCVKHDGGCSNTVK